MKASLRNLCLAILLTGVSLAANAAPVDGQIFQFAGNGHFYAWIDNRLSWPDANAAAGSYSTSFNSTLLEDWHLATITSQAENDFLVQTVLGLPASFVPPYGSDRAWIGLFNEHGANSFEWVTGESTAYTNWETGEPNNPDGTVGTLGRFTSGKWNDEFDDADNGGFGPLAFLVEHNEVAVVPVPAAFWLFASALAGLAGYGRRRITA